MMYDVLRSSHQTILLLLRLSDIIIVGTKLHSCSHHRCVVSRSILLVLSAMSFSGVLLMCGKWKLRAQFLHLYYLKSHANVIIKVVYAFEIFSFSIRFRIVYN